MSHLWVQFIWLVPCYPFLGGLVSALWFPSVIRNTGPRPAGYMNALMSFVAFVHSALAFSGVSDVPAQHFSVPWLQVAGLELTIPVEVSALTVGALIVITGLNLIAQIYAIGYLEMDWGWARLFLLLGLFESGMSALALCDSLFFSYILLEILTLSTYLLVGLWFNQSLVVAGARDAFLTKRSGDLILLMAVLAIYPLTGTWDYDKLADWSATANVDPNVITLVCLGLIAGPMAKCAQFPLHLWLDEAMEGPLPASILRNAVVVSTGAWVLVRLQPVLELSPLGMTITVVIGSISAVGGALLAIGQVDVKRVLSYLVSSYMGVIFIAIGTDQIEAACVLMLVHAFAASLLLMSVGQVIWNAVSQDLRQFGGLWGRRPISGLSFVVGALSAVALPPLGGFWAMLKLVDGLWETRPEMVAVIAAVNVFAGFALFRCFGLVWGGKPNPMTTRSPEVFWPMMLPTLVTVGVSLHVPQILAALDLLPAWSTFHYDHALVLAASSSLGCLVAGVIYLNPSIAKPLPVPALAQGLVDFFSWVPSEAPGRRDPVVFSSPNGLTPTLYRRGVVLLIDWVSQMTASFDKYFIDGLSDLFGAATIFSGQTLRYITGGQSQFYLLTILVGIALIGAWLCWPVLSNLTLVFGQIGS
jgi:NAD(P)H-quinone oxidoreductase subunit 5